MACAHGRPPRLDVTTLGMAGSPTPCHGAYPRNYPIKSPRLSNSLLPSPSPLPFAGDAYHVVVASSTRPMTFRDASREFHFRARPRTNDPRKRGRSREQQRRWLISLWASRASFLSTSPSPVFSPQCQMSTLLRRLFTSIFIPMQ